MLDIKRFITEARNKKQEEEVAEGISILDQIIENEGKDKKQIDTFVKQFIHPNGPTIYAFITDKVDNAIKVGYTDQLPEKRIAQWKEIYGKNAGEVECIGYWSAEEFNRAGERVFFWDHAVHKKLKDNNYKQLKRDDFMASLTDAGKKIIEIHFSSEFFDKRKYKDLYSGELDPDEKSALSAEILELIINGMKENIRKGTYDFKTYKFDEEGHTSNQHADIQWDEPEIYPNTGLQKDAIKAGVAAIKSSKATIDEPLNLLMAAVMRFGKTHASYEIVKGANLRRVIVCSAKADVRDSWRNDINHEDFYKDFVFIEINKHGNFQATYCKDNLLVTTEGVPNYEEIKTAGKTIIFFFTLHDLAGSVKELKERHKDIFNEDFDMMIVDETHYGSHANTFGEVTGLGRDNESPDDEEDLSEDETVALEQEINEETKSQLKGLHIKYRYILQVSGTPYYILASNEMLRDNAEIISKVSYTDMMLERDKWETEHPTDDPSDSPYFGIPTLHKIGLRLTAECKKAIQNKGMTDSMTALFEVKNKKFVHEKAIRGLMKAMFGDGTEESLAFLKNKNVGGSKVCKHTMIVLPYKKCCDAMKALLVDLLKGGNREVINIAPASGRPDVEGIKEYNDKLAEIDKNQKMSITVTCKRFLTGVSMPLLDSMIYLKNTSSSQEYDQNIFRLCTRHVKKVKHADDEARYKKVNMKHNVYLIDFNIGNMFDMIANSARMKAAAEGNATMERVEELMKEDVKAIPIFCDMSVEGEVLGKMKEIKTTDLMKVYTHFNKNKSIADIVNDEIDRFDSLFRSSKFQEAILRLDVEGDKSKINIDGVNTEGDETLDGFEDDVKTSLSDFTKDHVGSHLGKKEKQAFEDTKKKFKTITKNLLYCNICLEDPCVDIESMIDRVKKDKIFAEMLADFNISVKDIKMIYGMMSVEFKQLYNTLLQRMSMLGKEMSKDTSAEGYDRFMKALKGLGRLGKNEVVTPPEIVKKMIEKLDKSDYEKAERILIVNDKQGEFFYGIWDNLGPEIAKKCLVVPSSQVGKHLTVKALKTLGVDDYINYIMDLEDYDKSGKIDVNDFLKMTNEEVLKKNCGKKFDICLMNPPYAGDLHLKFIKKAIEVSNILVNISPGGFINNIGLYNTKDKYTDVIKHLKDVEFIDFREGNDYFGTANGIQSELHIGVYEHDYTEGKPAIDEDVNEVYKKIRYTCKTNLRNHFINHKKFKNYGIRIFRYHRDESKPYYENIICYQGKAVDGIDFKTKEELDNFIKSIHTWVYEFMFNLKDTNPAHLPYLDDYTTEWTDEKLYKLFNITEEEKKIIKNVIEKYYNE